MNKLMRSIWKKELSIYLVVPNSKLEAILLGYSGHGLVVAEAAELNGINLLGYADHKELLSNPYALDYLGDERESDFKGWMRCKYYLLGVGENRVRARIAKRVWDAGANCLTIIHPSAMLSKYIEIGQGSFLARNVSVNPLVKIGKGVIVNTSASMDHECIIGNYAHIAPGAVLAGNVKVGVYSFIGANSVIREGVNIGDGAIIGAGSVVLKDVEANTKCVGNPIRKI
jgi:sugar O-acyltransferase (sialic acid O-acetyltransferase NeuD family)